MLSLSSIELLLGVGLVSILPLVFVVLRATMGRVMHREELNDTTGRRTGREAHLRSNGPLQPHIAASRAKSRQNSSRRDRAA